MLKKHNKHGPLKWIATAAFLTAGLLVVAPVAKPVYAEDSSPTVQTSYVGFSSVSAVVENKVSVKQYGYYHIAFNGNGGNGSIDPMTLVTDETENLPANVFSRPGYTFTGWKGSDGKTYKDKASVKNLTDQNDATITMTAQWSANTYTAKFNLNYAADTGSVPKFADGSSDSITKKTDEKLEKLPEVTRPGYKFLGWYTTAGGGSQISADTTMPADGATYYAHWEIIDYQIRYDLGGHGHMDEQARPTHYTVEDTIQIDVPVEDSEGTVVEGDTTYYFTGWHVSGQDGYTYHLTIPKGSTGHKLLSATWNVNGFRVLCQDVYADARDHIVYTCDTLAPKFYKPGTVVKASDWGTHSSYSSIRKYSEVTVEPGQDNVVYRYLNEYISFNSKTIDGTEKQWSLDADVQYYDAVTGERIPDAEAEANGFQTKLSTGLQGGYWDTYWGGGTVLIPGAAYAGLNNITAKASDGTKLSYIEGIAESYVGESEHTEVDDLPVNGNTCVVDKPWKYGTYILRFDRITDLANVWFEYSLKQYDPDSGTFGYAFRWKYFDSDLQNLVNNLDVCDWELNGVKKTKDDILQYFNASQDSQLANRKIPLGSVVKFNRIVPKKGYALFGVYNDHDKLPIGKDIKIDRDMVLDINLIEDGYIVRFDANGGAGSDMKNQYMSGTSSDRKLEANTYTNAYADFLGWATTPDADKPEYKDQDSLPADFAKAGETKTLYAVWKWHETEISGAKGFTWMDPDGDAFYENGEKAPSEWND